jgi:hypothetical protein
LARRGLGLRLGRPLGGSDGGSLGFLEGGQAGAAELPGAGLQAELQEMEVVEAEGALQAGHEAVPEVAPLAGGGAALLVDGAEARLALPALAVEAAGALDDLVEGARVVRQVGQEGEVGDDRGDELLLDDQALALRLRFRHRALPPGCFGRSVGLRPRILRHGLGRMSARIGA